MRPLPRPAHAPVASRRTCTYGTHVNQIARRVAKDEQQDARQLPLQRVVSRARRALPGDPLALEEHKLRTQRM